MILRRALPVAALLLAVLASPGRSMPRLEVAFVLDATGSMGSEIRAVADEVLSLVAELRAGEPAPDVRMAVVAYRDGREGQGGEVEFEQIAFTREEWRIRAFLQTLEARGGGDYPEDVRLGLRLALEELDWSPPNDDVGRLLFLIGDAPPVREVREPTVEALADRALEAGVVVHTLATGTVSAERLEELATGNPTLEADYRRWLSTWKLLARRTHGSYRSWPRHEAARPAPVADISVVLPDGSVARLGPGGALEVDGGPGDPAAGPSEDRLGRSLRETLREAATRRGVALPGP